MGKLRHHSFEVVLIDDCPHFMCFQEIKQVIGFNWWEVIPSHLDDIFFIGWYRFPETLYSSFIGDCCSDTIHDKWFCKCYRDISSTPQAYGYYNHDASPVVGHSYWCDRNPHCISIGAFHIECFEIFCQTISQDPARIPGSFYTSIGEHHLNADGTGILS